MSVAASSTGSSLSRATPASGSATAPISGWAAWRQPAPPTSPRSVCSLIPEGTEFNPAEPWRLSLLVQRATGALEKAFVSFDLGYQPPDKYLKTEAGRSRHLLPPAAATAVRLRSRTPPAEIPLWQRIWENRLVDIAITLSAIAFLTGLFFFQDSLVRRPALYQRVRIGFLLFTLVWLGWYAKAQLSVVNIFTFADALRTEFRWDYFLMDPLVFILWFSVAASILFWGRGAFCGWLCPFGALQELLYKVGQLLHLPKVKVPFGVHQRLWPIKYMIFLVLFGLSMYSLSAAERGAEVEPFKTAIILHFFRDWWFVAVRGRIAGGRAVHRALLLPLPVPAGGGSRHPRPDADVRLAAPLQGMRQPVPALRQ